ncbi:MAG: universal stress protein [SAR202 cluster bacterium]|jgi:nucleotide-binding universal stress UspA family protein|nr:universal stress protein [SAR202 cluster bacterium]
MFDHILVPLDGSELAEQALPHASDIAKTNGATVHFIQVTSDHPEAAGFRSGLSSESQASNLEISRQLEQAMVDRARDYLTRIAAPIKNEGITVETELHHGSPHEHIVEYAENNDIDLIVMSSHGHGGVRRMLTGSTTDKVVRAAEVPVLVIPCED